VKSNARSSDHGGVSNAGTSYDFTHYFITLPSAGLDRAIDMLAEMVGASTLDAAELEKERLVILEEYRRKQDNPEAMLFEDLLRTAIRGGSLPPFRHRFGDDHPLDHPRPDGGLLPTPLRPLEHDAGRDRRRRCPRRRSHRRADLRPARPSL
jgi:hypothetical protein